MTEQLSQFIKAARKLLGRKRVMTDPLRRLAWGTDAGFYRYIPKVVVHVRDDKDVSALLAVANEQRLSVTFRAAGTSLSGQAVGEDVLMVAGKGWEDWRPLDPDASVAEFQPGLTGKRVNELLRPYGRRFYPDPASINSAMVGGIVANNASGMNCGTHANSYKVLLSAKMILADGTVLDTGSEESKKAFRQTNSAFLNKIAKLRDDIRADKELVERIRHKYSIKNVVGLNLLPFIEFHDPFDIMTRVLVGSEGTLAFISSVTMITEKIVPLSASAMLYFHDVVEACRAVQRLKELPVVSAELLDTRSLLSVNDPAGDKGWTALLTETKAEQPEQLKENIEKITEALGEFNLATEAHFSLDKEESDRYWKVRSGVFPSVGANRPIGKTVLIEDVAFHLKDLPEATADLLELLKRHGYGDACIYGHVLEGNYHFIISQSFDSEAEIKRYQHLMEDVEKLVVDKYDGSLKAEHGTGRNMAPFVEKEWGSKAFNAMKRLKEIFDPRGILNPGVIFNDDPLCYINNLKPMPVVDPVIDRCIECGFCEINCVSCGYALSSRQRIVAAREMARLAITGENPSLLRQLRRSFRKLGNELCAGDGLCSTSCPVKINTGEYIHHVRDAETGKLKYHIGASAAKNLSTISATLRPVLKTAATTRRVIGASATNAVGKTLHAVGMPLWTSALPDANFFKQLPAPAKTLPRKAVYLPSCINRTMGASIGANGKEDQPLTDVMARLMEKAGYEVIYPEGLKNLCCGMIWESKGMPGLAEQKLEETRDALMKASENGKYPIVCDQSPCLHRLREHINDLKLHEPGEFIHDYLLPYLAFEPEDSTVALHLTCSSRLMPGVTDKIIAVARKCVREVVVPEQVGCCGFAGDKGFTHPGLNKFALRHLRPLLQKFDIKEGFSNSRTCEIGLTSNGNIPYKSIVYLVDRVTTPKSDKE